MVSLPKLDGTVPTRPVWSPDSQNVAFLWNDHGMPFRDLWLASPAGLTRLTHFAPDPAESTLDEVDPERIGIWGNSYGGLLVLSALFCKPGLFAAGVAGAPAVDVWHFTGFDQHLTRRPDTHPEIFATGSLLDWGQDLSDPLLIIHGLHDDIVPLKTTLMLAERLKLLGRRFELDIVHDSGHWWAESEHYAIYTFGRLIEFMHRHVPPGPQ